MKKIDAYWELKNLNTNVLEVEFYEDDNADSIHELIENFDKYGYILAKIPRSKINLIHYMEDLNFKFIESQLSLYNNLNKEFPINNYIKMKSKEIKLKQITNQEGINRIISNIDVGMFDMDRISLDPFFGHDYARKRYINWIIDEYIKGESIICEMEFKSNALGFFLIKNVDNGTYNSVLAGLYSGLKNLGLGFSIIERPIAWCRENDVKKLITRVSTNNLESLRLHMNFGYEIKNVYYVFRRLNKNLGEYR